MVRPHSTCPKYQKKEKKVSVKRDANELVETLELRNGVHLLWREGIKADLSIKPERSLCKISISEYEIMGKHDFFLQ